MELTLQHPRNSLSCYIAPPNAIGLGPHHDETEIFTLQISGRKQWRLYHRIECDRPGMHAREELTAPIHDFMLEAGDLLYLPGGWIHEVTSEEPAFSLAIVFDPVRWSAVLDVLAAKLAATKPFMAPMPAGVLLEHSRLDFLDREFKVRVELIRDALAAMNVYEVANDIAGKLLARMTLPPDAQLDVLFRLDQITLDTVVEKRPGIACYLTRSDEAVVIGFPGGYTLRASVRVEPALLSILAANRPFRIREMHDSLAESAKLALTKKLVGCGLLRVVTPA